jgi:hypothetical protein
MYRVYLKLIQNTITSMIFEGMVKPDDLATFLAFYKLIGKLIEDDGNGL